MAMNSPFHFAFFVRDLKAARSFYGGVLGCEEGRSTDGWVDFDFFGNQISAHRSDEAVPARSSGSVENVAVPMPHFGAILPWDRFQTVVDAIRAAGIPFVIEPTTRAAGQPGEQMTMFVLDPTGNALEFKSFRHPEHVFTR